jgi:hypothetical protein
VNLDELEKKIIEVKKKGLNILIENELIADVRGQYYNELIEKKLNAISDRVRRNILFLNKLHKNNISGNQIREFMGIEVEPNLNKIAYESYNITSLRTAIILSEFYGVPVELFLFQDIESNAEIFRSIYPALFRQSRD